MSVGIHFEHIVKKYGENVIIPDLNLDVKEGEFFTLLGPSGCGKTTLLRMVAGFNSIEGGTIAFNGKVINDIAPNKRNIGMVFQNYAVFPHMTVRENVAFGLENRHLPKNEIKKRVDEILETVKITQYADRLPERLSGGQQQRVALARAIVIKPDVLLMDEPLSNLDAKLRIEMRNEIMERVNNVLYESKLIGYPNPFRNKVRTFCQNPGGFVSQENYDGGLAVVNGHSYKERKSENTNLAILCTHNFLEPFNQPIAYAKKIGELCNALGAGHILVQRFGDILDGKRTWQKELSRSNVRPTLPDAVAGDVTAALPYRTMTSIINFMLAVDEAIPGFASAETLLYAPELKFYSNRVKMDANFDTNIANLHCLGDSSGWTRGLMMASVMGCLMGERLASGA